MPHFPEGCELRYCVGKAASRALPLEVLPVTAHVYDTKAKRLAVHLSAHVVRPAKVALSPEDYVNYSEHLSLDLSRALDALFDSHLAPSELLLAGLRDKALLHVDLLETSTRYQGLGLGASAVSALAEVLKSTHDTALMLYRPYPMQHAGAQMGTLEFSHNQRALDRYAEYLNARAAVSRHYAKKWRGKRLPRTEYFLASVGNYFTPVFSPSLEAWALLQTELDGTSFDGG